MVSAAATASRSSPPRLPLRSSTTPRGGCESAEARVSSPANASAVPRSKAETRTTSSAPALLATTVPRRSGAIVSAGGVYREYGSRWLNISSKNAETMAGRPCRRRVSEPFQAAWIAWATTSPQPRASSSAGGSSSSTGRPATSSCTPLSPAPVVTRGSSRVSPRRPHAASRAVGTYSSVRGPMKPSAFVAMSATSAWSRSWPGATGSAQAGRTMRQPVSPIARKQRSRTRLILTGVATNPPLAVERCDPAARVRRPRRTSGCR